MRRFNIFQTSHSALRSLLLDTSLQIQFTDFSCAQQVQGTFDQVMELVLACQRQAEEEGRYIVPAILAFNKNVNAGFASGEDDFRSPAMHLLRGMDLFEKEAGSGRAIRFAPGLLMNGFRRFAEYVIAGMQAQEDHLNPLLWACYSDDALRGLQLQVEGRQTMSEWLSSSEWMIRDMSDEEIAKWLLSVRGTLPVQVYELLVERISAKIPLLRWSNVQNGLQNNLMVA